MQYTNSGAPTLYFETDNSGNTYLRVEEQRISDFAADLVYANKTLNAQGVYAGVAVNKAVDVAVSNYDVIQERVGVSLRKTDDASIYDFKFDNFSLTKPEVYGSAIRIGDDVPANGTTGITYVQRIIADGHQDPLYSKPGFTYAVSNKDFVAVESGGNTVYLRDITASNFSDGMFDIKGGNTIYIMNATLDSAQRMFRVWDGANIVLVNCEIITAPGYAAVWLGGPNSTLQYYNTTWNGLDTIPTSLISREKSSISYDNVQKITSNPFDGIDFFETSVKTVHVQYSTDGKTWAALDTGKEGEYGSVGDNLFSLNGLTGDYYVRSYYTLEDGKDGEYSDVIHHQTDGQVELLPIEDFLQLHPFVFTGTDAGEAIEAGDDGSLIAAGKGQDTIVAGDGADAIDGGAHNDTVSYAHAKQAVHVDLADSSLNAGGAEGDTLTSIEQLTGSGFDDVLLGQGGENRLFGEAGNDILDGRAGHDWLNGGAGADVLIGGAGNDRLEGGTGNDRLIGGAGADNLKGGTGADHFVFSADDIGTIDRIVDFNVKEGDVLDLAALFNGLNINAGNVGEYVHLLYDSIGTTVVLSQYHGVDTTLAALDNVRLADLSQLVSDGVIAV